MVSTCLFKPLLHYSISMILEALFRLGVKKLAFAFSIDGEASIGFFVMKKVVNECSNKNE